MFSKIINLAAPGDRILIIVGAGHRFWLSHLASNTPGFEHIDVLNFLPVEAGAEKAAGTVVPSATR